jgi:uncharacterized protein YkwD
MPARIAPLGRVAAAVVLACIASCSSQQGERPKSGSGDAAPAVSPEKPRKRLNTAKTARAIHARINRERRTQGLPTLWWDGALVRIAGKHSRDMAKRNYFGHRSPDGAGPAQRYLREQYACGVTIDGVLRNGAEVIYRGTTGQAPSVEEMVSRTIETWLGHEEDRKNILSPHWQREGVGIFVLPDGMVYITVNFC